MNDDNNKPVHVLESPFALKVMSFILTTNNAVLNLKIAITTEKCARLTLKK